MRAQEFIVEVSATTLASYKTKAGQSATAADQRGDYNKGHKRFKGIVQATNKEFGKSTQTKEDQDFDFPAPEKAQRTQIAGTAGTYQKAKAQLDQINPKGRTLDYGAGLGHGGTIMGADTYEPFPRGEFKPTHSDAKRIPDNSYEKITNFNVLNVVPPQLRTEIVQNIGRILAPGGVALITTRGRDVMSAKGRPGPEPMSIVTSAGTYQKGFTTRELMDYVHSVLGNGFEVSPLRLGPAGVIVKKK